MTRWRTGVDHAGLEALLADEVPDRSDRCDVRDLVALLVDHAAGTPLESPTMPEGLETREDIDARLAELGVRSWPWW